jgi:EmrB/QacA subfamily drug resistance transporter
MRTRTIAMTVLIAASFLDLMDAMITNVALPTIQADLGASPIQLEWTMAGYLIAFATLLVTGGRLGDRYGRRSIFLIGILGFTVASLSSALAPSAEVLVAARIAQGAFAGLMVPQSLASVQVLYKPEERAPLYAIIGSISVLGTVAGQVLGGWLTDANLFDTGWRSIFLINVPIGIALAALALRFVPNSRSSQRVLLDPVGILLAAAAVLFAVLPLTVGRSLDWPAWTWAMLAAAPVALLLLILQQRALASRGGNPLFPVGLFTVRGFGSGLLVQGLFAVASGSYAMVTAFYLQQALGFSSLQFGLSLLPISVGAMIGSGVVGPLAKRFGKPLVVIGGLVQAGGFVWVRHLVDARGGDLNGWDLALPLAVVGLGLIAVALPLADIALARVPTVAAGAASGTLSTVQQFGSAIGLCIAGAAFFSVAELGGPFETMQQAQLESLWIPVAVFAITGLAALALPSRRPMRDSEGTESVSATAAAGH